MDTIELVKKLIKDQLNDAEVEVNDLTGTNDHLGVQVTSKAFSGKSLIEQHRIVMEILKEPLKGSIHALKIKTKIPN
jgi:stress-induced morphogen